MVSWYSHKIAFSPGELSIYLIPYINIKYACPTCFEKTAMSSLNDSDEHTSPPATEGSLGVQVANSHFSNISASKGNNGCLKMSKNVN